MLSGCHRADSQIVCYITRKIRHHPHRDIAVNSEEESLQSALRQQIPQWHKEGILDSANATRLAKHYNIDVSLAQTGPQHDRSRWWVPTTAALLAFGSVVILISRNWDFLSPLTRSALCLLPLLATWVAMAWGTQRKQQITTDVAGFLSTLLTGANIILQAQIWNVHSGDATWLLAWMAAGLPILLTTRFAPNYALLTALAMAYYGLETRPAFALSTVAVLMALNYRLKTTYNSALASIIALILSTASAVATAVILERDFNIRITSYSTIYTAFAVLFYSETSRVMARYGRSLLTSSIGAAALCLAILGFAIAQSIDDLTIGSLITYTFPFLNLALLAVAAIRAAQPMTLFVRVISAGAAVAVAIHFLGPDPLMRKLLLFLLNGSLGVWSVYHAFGSKNKSAFLFGLGIILAAAAQITLQLLDDNEVLSALLLLVCAVALMAANKYWKQKTASQEYPTRE